MNRTQTSIAAVLTIVVGITTAIIIYATRPKAERKPPQRMTPVVQAEELCREDRFAELELMGKVIPAESVELRPRVSGRIVTCHTNWIEGGLLLKDETVIKLEDNDYRIALKMAESELALELGRQDVAKREWDLIRLNNPSDMDRTLAMREPQVKSARARVEQANLNFDRTGIKAPFNAIVTARNMNRGDQATTQTALGRIVNTDYYHIRVSLPVDELKWLVFPHDNQKGSEAVIHLPGGAERKGRVIRLLGDLEEEGRMARCLVEVKDPLKGNAPILLNSFVTVNIKGKPINNAYCINRNNFRENSRIWLITKDNKLRTLDISPLWSDRERIFFRADIPEGDMLITSALNVIIDGTELRRAEEETPESKPATAGEQKK